MATNHIRNISLPEVIDITTDILANVSVPIKFGKSISEPLVMAVKNLAIAGEMANEMQAKIDDLTKRLSAYEQPEDANTETVEETSEEPQLEVIGSMPVEEEN